ncbi:MAG: Uma2 family endonuclease [Archangium sp.]
MEALQLMPSPPRGAPPARVPITRELFQEMWRRGLFGDNHHIELIEGELYVIAPMGEPHARPVQHINVTLARELPKGFTFRCQLPFAASDISQPQPDFLVFKDGDLPDDDMPENAALAIEVSDSTLDFDLKRKSAIYARAKVAEYWVLDVKRRELVIHRTPSGSKYRSVKRISDLSAVRANSVPGLELDLSHVFVKR